jgi:glycosyltransferase involved in cell wall biosynthesis
VREFRRCREVVRDGDNGLLVAPGDSVALANALRRLILDPGLRARYGARSRQRAELEFSEEPIISGTLRLYEDLLTQSRVSR